MNAVRTSLRLFLTLGLVGVLVVLFSGCTRMDPDDSTIPWGQPAAFENNVPGMPQAPDS